MKMFKTLFNKLNIFSTPLALETGFVPLSEDEKRSSLDNLFKRSLHYKTSENYIDALNFIVKLRNIAPFNAWLLREQNPNITYVANAPYWKKHFGRGIHPKARAYVILRAFGPVEFVYDVKDTLGAELPTDLKATYRAEGEFKKHLVQSVISCCTKKGISIEYDASLSEREAGWASHNRLNENRKIVINADHSEAVQFATLCHELAHLMLGHLRYFKDCECKNRSYLDEKTMEVEAESVSWLVCKRLELSTNSDSYLNGYFSNNSSDVLKDVSIDNILTTAGRIESMIFNKTCKAKKAVAQK